MANEFEGKRVKVYAQGAFATGVCTVFRQGRSQERAERYIQVRTDSGWIAEVYNPGIIFVEADHNPFPTIKD